MPSNTVIITIIITIIIIIIIIIVIIVIIIIILFASFFFPTSVRWWSFTGVWVTISLLRSPLLFSPILAMLWSVWCHFFFNSNPINFFSKLLGIIPSAPMIIGIPVMLLFHSFLGFFNSLAWSKYFSIFSFFFFFLFSLSGPSERQNR